MINVKTKFTYADYMKTSDDERYELLNGELVMSPSPKELHQSISGILYFMIVTFVRDRGLGKVYFAPFDVVLSDTNVVQPDLLFVSNARAAIITADNVQGAPDLVVEILAPATAERDRTVKLDLYARHGVKEYWLVWIPTPGRLWCCCEGRAALRLPALMGKGRPCIHRRWRGSASRWRRCSEG